MAVRTISLILNKFSHHEFIQPVESVCTFSWIFDSFAAVQCCQGSNASIFQYVSANLSCTLNIVYFLLIALTV